MRTLLNMVQLVSVIYRTQAVKTNNLSPETEFNHHTRCTCDRSHLESRSWQKGLEQIRDRGSVAWAKATVRMVWWAEPGVWSKKIWGRVATTKILKVVTFGESFQFSEPLFPHLPNGDRNSSVITGASCGSLVGKHHFNGFCNSRTVFSSDICVLFLPDPRGDMPPRRIALLGKNTFYILRSWFFLVHL